MWIPLKPSEGGTDVNYKRAAQSRRLAFYHECYFRNPIDCDVLVLRLDRRGRCQALSSHIDFG